MDNIKDYFDINKNQPDVKKSGDTYKQLSFYYKNAQYDIEKFKKQIEKWFEEMMKRSQGWYKKRIQVVLLIVGLIITTIFNVDTIAITKKLSKDPKAREYFVEAAAGIEFSSSDLVKMRKKADEKKTQALDSLFDESFKVQEVLSLSRCSKSSSLCKCQDDCNSYWYSSWLNFFGCLLSALAISLGAPFWYDLLNRLMQLRASVSSNNKDLTKEEQNKEPKDLKG